MLRSYKRKIKKMNQIQQVLKLLRTHGKDSKPVSDFMDKLKAELGEEAEVFKGYNQLVGDWPVPASAQLKSAFSKHWRKITGVAVGGTGVIALVPNLRTLLNWLPLPVIEQPLYLLPVVALLGALSGFCYSVFCNRGVVIPSFQNQSGVLVLTKMGFFNELLLGGIAAITTVWVSTVGLNGVTTTSNFEITSNSSVSGETVQGEKNEVVNNEAGDSKNEDPEKNLANKSQNTKQKSGNLLTFSVIIASAVSGWFGARMSYAKLNESLLRHALAEASSRNPAQAGIESSILEASSSAEAVIIAIGKPVVGTLQSTALMDQVGETINLNLLKPKLESRPLQDNKHILVLGMLKVLGGAKPGIAALLGELKVADVASRTKEEFKQFATKKAGVAEGFDFLLDKIHKDSKATMECFDHAQIHWPATPSDGPV